MIQCLIAVSYPIGAYRLNYVLMRVSTQFTYPTYITYTYIYTYQKQHNPRHSSQWILLNYICVNAFAYHLFIL